MNSSNFINTPGIRNAFTLLLILPFIAGCEQSLSLKVESEVPVPLVTQIPVSVGVYYDEQFRNHIYTENSTDRKNWSIESGPSQVALFDQVLSSMFRNVLHLSTLPAAGNIPDVDAVLSPSIEEMQFSLPRETRLDVYEAWIKYKLRLFDRNGDLIADWPLTAYGKSSTEMFKSRDQGLNSAINTALRDAGAKMALGFTRVTGVKSWLANTVKDCASHGYC